MESSNTNIIMQYNGACSMNLQRWAILKAIFYCKYKNKDCTGEQRIYLQNSVTNDPTSNRTKDSINNVTCHF